MADEREKEKLWGFFLLVWETDGGSPSVGFWRENILRPRSSWVHESRGLVETQLQTGRKEVPEIGNTENIGHVFFV